MQRRYLCPTAIHTTVVPGAELLVEDGGGSAKHASELACDGGVGDLLRDRMNIVQVRCQ